MMALQLRSKARTFTNPSFIRLFSTTSSSNPSNPSDPNDESNSSESNSSASQSSMSSYFSDVKASLRQTQSYPRPEPRRPASSSSNHPSFSKPSKIDSFDEICKNLSEFRRATSAPPPPTAKSNSTPTSSSPRGSGSSQHISFQELYKQNVIGMAQNAEKSGGGRKSFDAIKESLKELSSSQNEKKGVDPMSLSRFKNTLRLKPTDSSSSSFSSPSVVIGGTDASPFSLFGEESREKKDKERSNAMRTEFVKMYSYGELGQKLKTLRPVPKGDDWFSLGELNDRLMKLRDLEDKEIENKIGGDTFRDLRDSLLKMKQPEDEKPKCK